MSAGERGRSAAHERGGVRRRDTRDAASLPPDRRTTAPGRPAARLVLAAVILTLAVRTAAGFTSTNWLWGLEPARYWPPAGHLALVLVALLGFVPAIGRRVERLLDRLGDAWERAGLRGDLAVAAVMALILFSVHDPVRFTGDSSLREGIVTMPPAAAARLLVYYSPLDLLANIALPRLLWRLGVGPVTGLHLVGGLVGGAFTLLGCRFLRAGGARRGALAGGALVLLGAGTLPHFAGYDKLGPLMVGLALGALGAVQLARDGRGVGTLVAGAAVCVLSHRSGYLVMPAVAWALIGAFRAARDARGRRAVILAAACVAAAAAATLPHALSVVRRVDLAVHLPGGTVAAARTTMAAPAPLVHASDAINVLWFLVPLWLVGVAAALAARTGPAGAGAAPREVRRPHVVPLAATTWLAVVPMWAMVFVISPGGGWSRDWDNAVGAAALASLFTAHALGAWWRRSGMAGTAWPIGALGLSAAVALWGIHANEGISLRRIEALLEGSPPLSDAARAEAYDLMGQRALTAGHPERAAFLIARAITFAPNPRYFHELGMAQASSGQLAQAEESFRRACDLIPAMPEPWFWRGRVALARGDSLTALAYLDSALARNPGLPGVARLRSELERAHAMPGR